MRKDNLPTGQVSGIGSGDSMKKWSLLAAVAMVAALSPLVPAAQAAGPRVVTASGRSILVDGQPYTVKGYNYTTDATRTWPVMAFASDPEACRNDAKLLAGGGVNTIRIWWSMTGATTTQADELACLDALWAEGIGVIWTLAAPGGRPNVPGFMETYQALADIGIERFKNHPATLMWLVGNEWELRCGNAPAADLGCRAETMGTQGGAVGILNPMLEHIKALDPNHLVGTTVCCGATNGAMHYNLPALEVWGINMYPSLHYAAGVTNFENTLDHLSVWDPDRPKIFTELGVDRFWCIRSIAVDGTNGPCKTAGGRTPPQTSGEYPKTQSDYFTTAWDSMVAHSDDVTGATFFMFSDMWNKCSLLCGGVGTPFTHDVYPEGIAHAADGPAAAEWWGVAHSVPFGATYTRVTTMAFDELARRWSAAAIPTITSGPTYVPRTSPCTYDGGQQYRIRATWTTDLPTTSEVYYSIPGQTANGGGDMIADNSQYEPVASDATLTTNHSIAFDTTLGRGRVIIRSFTATGQSVSHPPVDITCGDL